MGKTIHVYLDKARKDVKAKDATNHLGEREYQTYEAWKRACKVANPSVVFEGNSEICNAKPGVGEWDGEKGSVYTKDSKAKDAESLEQQRIRIGQSKVVNSALQKIYPIAGNLPAQFNTRAPQSLITQTISDLKQLIRVCEVAIREAEQFKAMND